jgi:HEAT repeat protein
VFVSYRSEDRQDVESLARDLRAQEMDIWLDRDSLRPGQRWLDRVSRSIADADFFVACFSSGGRDRESYMDEEIRMALERGATRERDDSPFLVPVFLDRFAKEAIPAAFREAISALHWVELGRQRSRAIEHLVEVIHPRHQKLQWLLARLANGSLPERIDAASRLGAFRDFAGVASAALGNALVLKGLDTLAIGMETQQALQRLGAPGMAVLLKHRSYVPKTSTPVHRQVLSVLAAVSGDEALEFQASYYLDDLSDPAATGAWIRGLRHKRPRIREAAARGLGRSLGRRQGTIWQRERALGALTAALSDPADEVQTAAIESIGRIGPVSEETVLAVCAMVDRAPGPVAVALSKLGASISPAVFFLVRALASPDEGVVFRARRDIADAVSGDGEAVMKDGEERQRWGSNFKEPTTVESGIVLRDHDALDGIRRLSSSTDATTRIALLRAILVLNILLDEHTRHFLGRFLTDENETVRQVAETIVVALSLDSPEPDFADG